MPKFNFEVEVTGAVEAWELAIAIEEQVNAYYKSGNRGIYLEHVAVPNYCLHADECYCEEADDDE